MVSINKNTNKQKDLHVQDNGIGSTMYCCFNFTSKLNFQLII